MTITQTAPSRTRMFFRIVAIAEALSWAGLLVAMVFKWLIQDDPHSGIEGGVPIMGPIHGGIFVIYVLTCLYAWRKFQWTPKVAILALASSIPPFFTYLFEVKADRKGLLGRPAA